MVKIDRYELDRFITGNYGEDQFLERYSIGHLENPEPQDEQFDISLIAEDEAVKKSGLDDRPWGVWENNSGELLAIIYLQTIFRA